MQGAPERGAAVAQSGGVNRAIEEAGEEGGAERRPRRVAAAVQPRQPPSTAVDQCRRQGAVPGDAVEVEIKRHEALRGTASRARRSAVHR